jgi:hypothetical protein
MRVLSLGGGTQSCALALMSAAGDLPKLDHIVFADTQGELPETYEYLEYLRSVVEPAGIPLHIVTAGNLESALLGQRMAAQPSPPAHLTVNGQDAGRLNGHRCSYDFKRRIVAAHIKRLCGKPGTWKRSDVEQWLGFSTDESHRAKDAVECRCGHNRYVQRGKEKELVHTFADGCLRCDCAAFDPWMVNRFPLLELDLRRQDTIDWFGAHGYRTPGRSACWFCPNSTNVRWRRLRSDHPDLWERACAIDEAIRDVGDFRDRTKQTFKPGAQFYLHEQRVALRDADLDADRPDAAQGVLDLGDEFAPVESCDAEVCFT